MSELAVKQDVNDLLGTALSPINEYITKLEFINSGGNLKNSSNYSNNEIIQIADMSGATTYAWTMIINRSYVPYGSNIIVKGNMAGSALEDSQTTYIVNSNSTFTSNKNYINYTYNNTKYSLLMDNNLGGTLTFYLSNYDGEDIEIGTLPMKSFVNEVRIELGSNAVEWYGISNNLSYSWPIDHLYLFDSPVITNNRSYLGTLDEVESKFGSLGYSRGKSITYNHPYVTVIRYNNGSFSQSRIQLPLDATLWGYYLYYNEDLDRYEWVEAYTYTEESGMDSNKYYGDLGRYSYDMYSYWPSESNPQIRCRQAAEWI